MPNPTAGRHDPMWYESMAGLLRVVEMMHPDSPVHSVSFQMAGVKGWDDVVVDAADGTKTFFQVKHSRVEGETLTFGDLVSREEGGASLLEELYLAWRQMPEAHDPRSRFVIFSNRITGKRAGRSDAGVQRPALEKFVRWLVSAATQATSLSDLTPPPSWRDAWMELLGQLAEGSDDERLAFLRALEIRADQGDLIELQAAVQANLGELFQITAARAEPLVHALVHALQRWTTGKERVTAEDAYSALALPPEPYELTPPPPPPAPFFRSRAAASDILEGFLGAGTEEPPVLFLSAEPGEGKTSVVSWLANRRSDTPLANLVGLRYFCFEPITPESPLVAEDAGERVRADRLWYALLAQLRDGLKGRLRELRVPVRNDLLSWPDARGHVLRLAETLGRERGQPFVIAIDGIDHAARALQPRLVDARAFFQSLPSPDELAGGTVRLFIAGQPAAYYPVYPDWLRGGHPGVQNVTLPTLNERDVLELYEAAHPPLPEAEKAQAVEIIMEAARGNTLATVFAVAEAQTCTAANELSERLTERRLHDGVQRYYETIWEFALAEAAPVAKAIEPCVIGTITLAREEISPALFAGAFRSWQYPPAFWQHLLLRLGPLLVESADGFRVRHNDVRVFLARRFATVSIRERRQIASDLADYYFAPESGRLAAHASLFSLLEQAGRTEERARIFTVDWVFEAGALGVGSEQLQQECAQALRAATALREWSVVYGLACAAQTLDRLIQRRRNGQSMETPQPRDVPFALPSEIAVVPVQDWQKDHLSALVRDAQQLTNAGLSERARALIERWLGKMEIVHWVYAFGLLTDAEGDGQTVGIRSDDLPMLEMVGRLCRRTSSQLELGTPTAKTDHQAHSVFERGYVLASCQDLTAQSLVAALDGWHVRYLSNLKEMTSLFAANGRWPLVAECLAEIEPHRDKLGGAFLALAAYWSIRATGCDPVWQEPLSLPGFGLERAGENLSACLAVCRTLGWRDAHREPGMIAEEVEAVCSESRHSEEEARAYRLIFRCAALLGRVLAVQKRHGWTAARDAVLASQARDMLAALWNVGLVSDFRFRHYGQAATLAEELVEVCHQFGGAHQEAMLDVALRELEGFPLDLRQKGLWKAVRLAGRFDVLRGLVEHWIGSQGSVWEQRADFSDDTVKSVCRLAREIGEEQLAARAEERSRWLCIGYRSHEDDAFRPSAEVYSRLSRLDPASWRGPGWRLWKLSERSEAQGAGNHWRHDIDEAFSDAAFRAGPSDAWQQISVWFRERRTMEEWNWQLRNRVVGSVSVVFDENRDCQPVDKIALWCLAVGLCRWFEEGDVKSLWRLKTRLLDSARDETERAYLVGCIERLTLGEAQRKPPEDSEGTSFKSELMPIGEAPAEECDRLRAENRPLTPRQVAAAIRQLTGEGEEENKFRERVGGWLAAIGEEERVVVGWRHHNQEERKAIFEIARWVPDDTLWSFIAAIMEGAGRGEHWLLSVTDNLNLLTLARAEARGAVELRRLLDPMLAMHERWLRGEETTVVSENSDLLPGEVIESWPELALRTLLHLLGARSSEVLSSTITGIHALVEHCPDLTKKAFQLVGDQRWKARWLLNCAEAWAAIIPQAMEPLRETLASLTDENHSLEIRLQAWVVLAKLDQVAGRARTDFPLGGPVPPVSTLIRPSKAILHTEDTVHGSIRLVGLHKSIKSKLNRLEACTRHDFRGVETYAAELLAAGELLPDNRDAMHRYGDFLCATTYSEDILSQALAPAIDDVQWTQAEVPLIAQGFLDGEEPWVLRRSPLPSSQFSDWPTPDQLDRNYDRPPPTAELEKMLLLLATDHSLPPDTQVLAARVQVFSWREDFTLSYWWVAGERTEGLIHTSTVPMQPDGRTFPAWLENRFEPRSPAKPIPLVRFAGSSQRLAHSCLDMQLSRRLTTAMRWSLDPRCAIRWCHEKKQVALYESLHGPDRSSPHGPHYRKPLLNRWLISCEAFAEAGLALGGLRPIWRLQREGNVLER